MERTRNHAPSWSLVAGLPGFHPNCPKRNVVVSLAYLHVGLVVMSLPGMV